MGNLDNQFLHIKIYEFAQISITLYFIILT